MRISYKCCGDISEIVVHQLIEQAGNNDECNKSQSVVDKFLDKKIRIKKKTLRKYRYLHGNVRLRNRVTHAIGVQDHDIQQCEEANSRETKDQFRPNDIRPGKG